MQVNLRDARELFAHLITILRDRRAQLVEIDLLEEVRIGRRTLPLMRVTRVENSLAIRRPRHAAAARGILHPRHTIRQLLARLRLEEVQHPVLAAVLRETHCHQITVGRRHIPVYGRGAVRVVLVEVENGLRWHRAAQTRQRD